MTDSAILITAVRSRLRDLLIDASSVVWVDGTLDEGIRQALGDIGRSLNLTAKITINGLDSAAATTLNVMYEDLLIRGAAGFAAASRVVDRGEVVSLEGTNTPGLLAWAKAQIDWFHGQLGLTSGSSQDAKTAAETAKLTAEAAKINAEAALLGAVDTAEAARLAGLHTSAQSPHTAMSWDEEKEEKW